jgi:hypothetical protein
MNGTRRALYAFFMTHLQPYVPAAKRDDSEDFSLEHVPIPMLTATPTGSWPTFGSESPPHNLPRAWA